MEQIPDAPYIREAEMYGMPPYETPICPICGEECETIYFGPHGNVFACNKCIQEQDAGEWWEEEKENSRPDWAEE